MTLQALPDDAILMHIGIHKTGTTALQSRLRSVRPALARHGVTYPGAQEAQHRPAMHLVNAVWGWNKRDPEANARAWDAFAESTRAVPGRVLLSSEFFCEANDEEAQRAVESLGADRIHVLVGFRHLADLLPSSWQQYLKSGRSVTYEDWLRAMLSEPPDPLMTPSFWKRNDVPTVLRRWVDLVGADRVTIVIADGDRERLGRVVCELLALPHGLLDSDAASARARSNRSMTAEEAELIRRANVFARDERGIPSHRYTAFMRNGAIKRMLDSREPSADETKLRVPPWAEERVSGLAAEHVAAIRASGARIIGDPGSLELPFVTGETTVPTMIPVDAASEALIGAIARTNDYTDPATLVSFRTQQLVDEVRRRIGNRARRTLRR